MYKRKTSDEWIIQGNYGQGFEDVDINETYKLAKENYKLYKENEPQYAHRLIKHRIKIEA
jgi:hypothetical protein